MKKQIIAVSLVALVSTTAAAAAQDHRHPKPGGRSSIAQKNMRQLTPAEQASFIAAEHLAEAAEVALNAEHYLEAETEARQAIADGEFSGFADETLASALYCQGKEKEALQAYKKMANAGTGFPRNLLPYALLLVKAGQWAPAALAYDKALPELDFGEIMRQIGGFSPDVPQPTDLEAAIHIGMGLTKDGADFHGTYNDRTLQALSHFQQALSLRPKSAVTNFYYGYGLQKLGREAEARAAFQTAVSLDKEGPWKAAAEQALRR